MNTRRRFIRTGSAILGAGFAAAQQPASPNDRIRIATIGFGGMGMGDTAYAVSHPGVELAAVCDIYDGRLTRAREVYGDHIFTTRDFREVLARRDIDSVIVATPDHWHAAISIAAMETGKHVYCEKPMVQRIEDGARVIDAQRRTGRIFQVGSQYVTSQVYQKARDLIAQGAIGRINMVEAWLDRNTALGAWQYSVPPDASPANIDWDRFLGNAPKRPFEPIRLFRWRNYRDYGTGVGGDLFVHLFSGLHFVLGSNGPTRVYTTGGIRYWKDGRDVPDVMLGLYDYPARGKNPAFNLSLRVDFKDGATENQGFRFIGSEGILTLGGQGVTISKAPDEAEPGQTADTFSKAIRDRYMDEYRQKYPVRRANADSMRPLAEERYLAPPGYNAWLEHHRNFLSAVRSRKPVIEDAVFGFRAAGPALLSNTSYFEERVCKWDPETMKMA
jgi:predicted dehydrogenase